MMCNGIFIPSFGVVLECDKIVPARSGGLDVPCTSALQNIAQLLKNQS